MMHIQMMQDYERQQKEGTVLPSGGRILKVKHDGRSGSTHVITGRYEGPVTAKEIFECFGDGTFGHRGPTLFNNGTFSYTKITD
jgi:hypothetical protein